MATTGPHAAAVTPPRRPHCTTAHGSPRDPVKEYMIPKDCEDKAKMAGCFELFDGAKVCFVGHSHVPGVYPESGGFFHPDDLGDAYVVDTDRAIINVGSVGQPRDGDPRARFAVVRGDRVQIERVPYDFRRTQAKILAAGLHPALAERLARGK